MSERPYWYPELTDAAWLARIREDYPEHADWDDEHLRDHYADGCKYADVWDHVGDARNDYERLADAFLAQAKLLVRCRSLIELLRTGENGQRFDRVESRSRSMVDVAQTLAAIDTALAAAGGAGEGLGT